MERTTPWTSGTPAPCLQATVFQRLVILPILLASSTSWAWFSLISLSISATSSFMFPTSSRMWMWKMRFKKRSTIVLAREQLPFHTFPFLLCSWVHEYPFGKISIFRGSNIWKVCEAEKSWWISCVLSIFLSAAAATSSLSLEPLPFAFLQTRPWKTSEFHLLTSKFKHFQTHFLAEKNSSEMLGRDAKEAPYIAAAVGMEPRRGK